MTYIQKITKIILSNELVKIPYNAGINYPTPSNLTYFWNFGSYALFCLIIQIVSGLFLAMHYVPDINLAFASVEHIMRDVNNGWLLRYIHANGASMFFIVVYTHMFRGLFYSSYDFPRHYVWFSGVLILFLMILTAFLGYVLPWGQMSFWGATVITNLVSAVPVWGPDLVVWLWGGYSIGNATLVRFFSLHFLLPFVILALVLIHIFFLHHVKSSNPLSISALFIDFVYFSPYYILKDFFGLICFLFFYGFFVFFSPNYLGHPDNYVMANPLVTPAHIVPEWYFLPFYAILRSIPDKLLGVLALLASILVLFLLPFVTVNSYKNLGFNPISLISFSFFFFICLILGWIGSKPVMFPFDIIGLVSAFFYFFYFFSQLFILFLTHIFHIIRYFFFYTWLYKIIKKIFFWFPFV